MRWPSLIVTPSNRTAAVAGLWSGVVVSVLSNNRVAPYVDVQGGMGTQLLILSISFFLPVLIGALDTSEFPLSSSNAVMNANLKRIGIWFLATGLAAMIGTFINQQTSYARANTVAGAPSKAIDSNDDAAWKAWNETTSSRILNAFNGAHHPLNECVVKARGRLQTSINSEGFLQPWELETPSGCPLLDEGMLSAANASRADLSPSPRRSTLLNFPFGEN